MFKKFGITEQVQAQLRVEFYNAFNHTNFGNPTVNINSGTFGVISSAQAARIGQIALKLVF